LAKNIELYPKKTTLLKIGKWTTPVLYEGERVVEEFSKYLGVLINQDLNLDEQLKMVENKIRQAGHKLRGLTNVGSPKYLCNMYQSLAVGIFSHALDCQPLFKADQYRKLQKKICDQLKFILKKRYVNCKINTSHLSLLLEAKLRSLYNTHIYLALNRLNPIFISEKPSEMCSELKSCLIASPGDYIIKPYSFDSGPNGETHVYNKSKYFSDVSQGKYSVKLRLPPNYPL
jgi:hypothetical protein